MTICINYYNKLSKISFISIFFTFVIIFSIFTSVSFTTINASTISNDDNSNYNISNEEYNEAENNIVSALNNIYSDHNIQFNDNNNQITYVNLKSFEDKYGDTPQIQQIKRTLQDNNDSSGIEYKIGGTDEFASCTQEKILQGLGISEIKLLFNAQALKFLKSHMFKEFANYILERATKVLGEKAAKFVVKHLASQLTPGWPEISIGMSLLECSAKVWL